MLAKGRGYVSHRAHRGTEALRAHRGSCIGASGFLLLSCAASGNRTCGAHRGERVAVRKASKDKPSSVKRRAWPAVSVALWTLCEPYPPVLICKPAGLRRRESFYGHKKVSLRNVAWPLPSATDGVLQGQAYRTTFTGI